MTPTPDELMPHLMWLMVVIAAGAFAVFIFRLARGKGAVRLKALFITFGALMLIWVLFVAALFAVEHFVREPLFHFH